MKFTFSSAENSTCDAHPYKIAIKEPFRNHTSIAAEMQPGQQPIAKVLGKKSISQSFTFLFFLIRKNPVRSYEEKNKGRNLLSEFESVPNILGAKVFKISSNFRNFQIFTVLQTNKGIIWLSEVAFFPNFPRG